MRSKFFFIVVLGVFVVFCMSGVKLDQAQYAGFTASTVHADDEKQSSDPCPECPECPDPAKVILRGLEEKKNQIDQARKDLEQERKELERYEAQLNEKLESLNIIQEQIQKDFALLEENITQRDIDKEAEYEEKMNRLVKMYAGMKPKNAAEIVNKMNLEVAQEIFLRMRETSASEILTYVDSEKAAKISERLAFRKK